MADTKDYSNAPLFTQYRYELAKQVAPLANIKPEEMMTVLEDKGGDLFALPIPKLRKYKIVGDIDLAKKWL